MHANLDILECLLTLGSVVVFKKIVLTPMSTGFVLIWRTVATTRILVLPAVMVILARTTRLYVTVVNTNGVQVMIRAILVLQ